MNYYLCNKFVLNIFFLFYTQLYNYYKSVNMAEDNQEEIMKFDDEEEKEDE